MLEGRRSKKYSAGTRHFALFHSHGEISFPPHPFFFPFNNSLIKIVHLINRFFDDFRFFFRFELIEQTFPSNVCRNE